SRTTPYHGCALVDIGLAPNALEFEAEPDCCCPQFVIERIALPSVAAIAEFIKGALHHQVHRLGRGNPTLKWRRVNDPANLDATSGQVNIQIARLTEWLPAREIDQCVFRAYAAGPDGVDSCAQFFRPGIRSPRKVRPEAAFAIRSIGSVQRLAMPGAVDWFDRQVLPLITASGGSCLGNQFGTGGPSGGSLDVPFNFRAFSIGCDCRSRFTSALPISSTDQISCAPHPLTSRCAPPSRARGRILWRAGPAT